MRNDSIGLFWQDIPQKRGKGVVNRIMPEIPKTGWVAPKEFPRLHSAPYISFDTETFDPELIDHGPGWGRGAGKGHIVGVSIAVPEKAWYFPVRHTVCPEENLNPEAVFSWLRDTFKERPGRPFIAANGLYDIGWLGEEDVYLYGNCYDVQFAEALLSEDALTRLDALGQKYLDTGKETSLLYQWASDYYGGAITDQRKNIYRCPPSLVGPYAEQDAMMPPEILPKQWIQLAQQGLLEVFQMETELMPLLTAMRRAGVQIDVNKAEQVRDQLVIINEGLGKQLNEMVGFEVNISANDSIQKAFNALGVPIPLHHKTGRPCFAKETLPHVEHPIGELIQKIRKYDKVRSTFIESYLLDSHVNGKVHCSIHPLRSDEGGARSGRFAYTKPNGQNIPSRDEEIAPLVRGCFIPFLGDLQWRRYDYNQVEYRGLVHYAVGPKSEEIRDLFRREPKTDYHIMAQDLVQNFTGLKIPRKPIKNFNFGMTFGMGKEKMVRTTTLELKKMGGSFKLDGEELYNAYHEAVPFTRETLDHFANLAKNVGYVTTILGRRSRFELWEPDERTKKGAERRPALPYHLACREYGKVKRAFLHKALNRVLQGSAADMMKMGMLKSWKDGVFRSIGVPVLTVHDELDFSDKGGNKEAWAYLRHTMETCIPMRIPILAELELGPDWGHCEKVAA